MPPSRIRLLILMSCLAGLIALIWFTAYSAVTREENNRTESEARRARQLAQFFEGHADDIFRYSDNYVKSIRHAYTAGSLEAGESKFGVEMELLKKPFNKSGLGQKVRAVLDE